MIERSIPMDSKTDFHCSLLSFASACSMQWGKRRQEPSACIDDRSWSINHSWGSSIRTGGSSKPRMAGYSSRHNNVAAGSMPMIGIPNSWIGSSQSTFLLASFLNATSDPRTCNALPHGRRGRIAKSMGNKRRISIIAMKIEGR